MSDVPMAGAGSDESRTDRARVSSWEQSDGELSARAAQGDARAWRVLVDRFRRLVYSIPKQYRLADDACDDVFQSVFAAFVKELPRIKDHQAIPKWLMTTAHRECWRVSKQNRTRGLAVDPGIESGDAPTDRITGWDRQHKVDRALAELGGRCERLLRMLYLMRATPSYDDIGRELGIAVGSIGPTRARCLAKMAELVPDDLAADVRIDR